MSDVPLTDAEKAIQQRGYSKGYAAGQRSPKSALAAEERQTARDDFRRHVFLAVIPAIGDEWIDSKGEHCSRSAAGKVKIAWDFADAAVQRSGL